MKTFDVLLSYNSKERAGVRKIFVALQQRGLCPWFDVECLVPGDRWQSALEEVIATIPAAAVCVGRDGLGPWEEVEMRAVLSEFVDKKRRVIPVLLPRAARKPQLPLFLRAFSWVDLRSGLTEEGIDLLVWGITGARPQRGAAARDAYPFAVNSTSSVGASQRALDPGAKPSTLEIARLPPKTALYAAGRAVLRVQPLFRVLGSRLGRSRVTEVVEVLEVSALRAFLAAAVLVNAADPVIYVRIRRVLRNAGQERSDEIINAGFHL